MKRTKMTSTRGREKIMNAIDATSATGVATAGLERRPGHYIKFNLFALAMIIMAVMFAGFRLYQQAFAWESGLDATSPEFDKYWMTMVKIELPVFAILCAICWGYLWFTRDRDLAALTPKVELRRYFSFTLWLVAYTFAIYFIGSFFAEGDGVWHQTVIRDTSFTPSHNVLFYACIPTYIFFSVGGFLYAMTRLPAFSRGISVAHVLAVLGPVLILPNLGFNEWGHAYWLTEEIFSHPLHWGFVVLGWNALALPGVALQIIQRMVPLFHEVFGSAQGQSA
jgi:methane/ammonia monooxygenase subunit C